jgi:hypothetical protein
VRTGRLTALFLAASALVLVVSLAPAIARMQKKHVVVVRGSGFRLIAWDSSDADHSLCFRLRAGTQSATQCEQVLKRKARLNFASFQTASHSFTLLGGVARSGVAKVVATFKDGRVITLRTKSGSRYRGRQRGHVRFWAGRRAGASRLTKLVAKNARGATVEAMNVSPPQPVPPSPEPPKPCGCHGPPTARIVCPLTPCPE